MIFVGGDTSDQRLPVGRYIFDFDTKIFRELSTDIDIKTGVLVGRRITHRHRIPVAGSADFQHTLFKNRMQHRVLGLCASCKQRRRQNKNSSCNKLLHLNHLQTSSVIFFVVKTAITSIL